MSRPIHRRFLSFAALLLTSCGGYQLAEVAPLQITVEREVLFDPDAEEFRPTAKLIFVVDNSASMEDEQELLSRGIASTFNQLKGYNLDILILTTSSSNGAENANATAVKVERSLKIAGGETSPLESESAVPRAIDQLGDYELIRKYKIKSLLPGDQPLQLRRSMSDDEVNAVRDQLVATIAQVGATGSNDETGLCTILRLLNERNGDDYLIKKGDRVALVVISDDNDYSSSASCTQEENQFYTWVAPVSGTSVIDVMPDRAEWFKYSTTWGAPERYELRTTYYDQNNPRPYHYVTNKWAENEYIELSYKYDAELNNDGQISTIRQTENGQVFYFNPADVGNPPLSSSSQECTEDLLEWAKTRTLKGPNVTDISCVYKHSSANRPQTLYSPLNGFTNSTSSQSCPAAAVSQINANPDTYSSLIYSGRRWLSCSYYYRATTNATQVNYFENLGSGVVYSSGTKNCTSQSELRSWAESTLANGRVYVGCELKTRAHSKSCSFDDLESKVNENQCINGDLKAHTVTRSSCTAAQLQNLIQYGCGRDGKARHTGIQTAAHYVLNNASSKKTSALDALAKRLNPDAASVNDNKILEVLGNAKTELFGSGFFFSAVVKPQDTSACTSNMPGGGDRYRDFADALKNQGYVHSICSETYAPAMDNISSFIVRILNNSYSVKTKETEEVIGVSIIRGDRIMQLQKDEDYSAVGGTIQFKDEILELGDKVQVRVLDSFHRQRKIE